MRFLVTAGPTHEPVDAVRYLANRSSGKMGHAIAVAAVQAGHDVILVSGPTALPVPAGVDFRPVETAIQMREAALSAFEAVDIVVMAAAVADYRPACPDTGKRKKSDETIRLELVRNPDILAEMGQKKRHQVLIGFALETHDELANALDKMKRKNLDLIVANGPENFGSTEAAARLIDRDGAVQAWNGGDKDALGRELVARALSLANEADAS